MLKFDVDNYKDLIEHFQSQKQIKSWSGVQTIKKHNLLHRAAKVPVIIDCLVSAVNNESPNFISQYTHLESMRNGMYEDLAKTILNDLSKKTKIEYPEYAKYYNKVLNQILSTLNLSKDGKVQYLAEIGDILNSYFEAKLENSLGNNTESILEALNGTQDRLFNANNYGNIKLSNKVIDISNKLIKNEQSVYNYNLIIENTQKQITVERWAKRLSLNDFTLLEHSARVTALVDIFLQINKSENNFDKSMELNIFRYSLYHDYPEVILNDMPSPVKQDYPMLDKFQKNTEKTIMDILKLTNSKTAKFVCKIADIYDCLYECKAEILAGNQDPEYFKNRDNYENTYKRQLNKFQGYINDNLIKNLEKMYVNPVIEENNQKLIENIGFANDNFIDSICNSIVQLSNKPNQENIKKLNKIINDLNNSQLILLKNQLKTSIILGDVDLDKIEGSNININNLLTVKPERVIKATTLRNRHEMEI